MSVKKQREEFLFIARLAENSERYKEMLDEVKKIIELGVELNEEERTLLSVAYKNIIGSFRTSWRNFKNILMKEKDEYLKFDDKVNSFRIAIENDLFNVCNEVFSILDSSLIPRATTCESQVFFYKMKGDYYRYLAEFQQEEEKEESSERSEAAYQSASDMAKKLSKTNSVRLGLALNFSVFYYEIKNDKVLARSVAQKAFDDAISEIKNVEENTYQDTTTIMQLLKDNLSIWKDEPTEDSS